MITNRGNEWIVEGCQWAFGATFLIYVLAICIIVGAPVVTTGGVGVTLGLFGWLTWKMIRS